MSILDYNDNNPVLSEESYSLVLDEDTSIKTIFDVFSYSDKDSGNNAVATYKLGNTSEYFFENALHKLILIYW